MELIAIQISSAVDFLNLDKNMASTKFRSEKDVFLD